MTIVLKKCFFLNKTTHCLRPMIALGRLREAQEKTQAFKMLRYSASISKRRLFQGPCNVFRRFVPNFAKLASPLNKKPKKWAPREVNLDDTEHSAVDVFKENIVFPPVSALSRLNGQYITGKDATDTQVRCVLQQAQKQTLLKPIDYRSCSLCDADVRYDIHHL